MATQQHSDNVFRYYPVRTGYDLPDVDSFAVPRLLMTYADSAVEKRMPKIEAWPCSDMLLDSGAFTARAREGEITRVDYAKFLHKHGHLFSAYINFDKMGDWKESADNLKFLEGEGLHPVPVWHRGTDIKVLEELLDGYDYICIGNLVSGSPTERFATLDAAFQVWTPGKKVHLLGMGDPLLLAQYPAYSSDSTSATLLAPRFAKFSLIDPADRNWKIWKLRETDRTWALRKLLLLHGLDINDMPTDAEEAKAYLPYLFRAALRTGSLVERCVREDRARLGTQFKMNGG